MEMQDAATMPAAWRETFDGTALDVKLKVSALLSTVAEDAWPHASFLGVGEVLADGPRALKLMLWPSSNAAANILRDGRAAFFAVADGAVWEARLEIVRDAMADVGLRMFAAEIVLMREHRAPYAEVEGLVSFRLQQEEDTLARWHRQIACLQGWI